MQFKELPECAQQTACNLLGGTYDDKANKTEIAKEIRDAFIALYSEPENAGAYENLDSVIKDAAGSIFSKKYLPCGAHVGNVYIVYADDISDAHKIGEFKNMFVFAPKGIESAVSQCKSESEHESGDTEKLSSPERLLLVSSIANAIISTVKEIRKPVGSHDFEQAMKSVKEMCTPGI